MDEQNSQVNVTIIQQSPQPSLVHGVKLPFDK